MLQKCHDSDWFFEQDDALPHFYRPNSDNYDKEYLEG